MERKFSILFFMFLIIFTFSSCKNFETKKDVQANLSEKKYEKLEDVYLLTADIQREIFNNPEKEIIFKNYFATTNLKGTQEKSLGLKFKCSKEKFLEEISSFNYWNKISHKNYSSLKELNLTFDEFRCGGAKYGGNQLIIAKVKYYNQTAFISYEEGGGGSSGFFDLEINILIPNFKTSNKKIYELFSNNYKDFEYKIIDNVVGFNMYFASSRNIEKANKSFIRIMKFDKLIYINESA